MRALASHGESHTSVGFMRGAQAVCMLAGLAWVTALVALVLVQRDVTYTICGGTLLQLPPPSVHWPPQGHNLGLLSLQHELTLIAMGTTIIGVFLVLHASPELSVPQRTGRLLAGVGLALLLAGILWVAGEYYDLKAHLDAVGNCL